jgi:thimet oligopeptidase
MSKLLPPLVLAAILALAATVVRAADVADGAAPTLPTVLPSFNSADQVNRACEAGLAGARTRVTALERVAPGLPWLRAWEGLNQWQEDTSSTLTFMQNVHPDAAVRSAAEACELKWADFQSTLGLDEKVYRGGVKSKPLLKDPVDRRTVQFALDDFEDSGVSLPAARRAKAKALSDHITQLGQQFSKHVRDVQPKVTFTVDELKGVPVNVWKDAPRDADGKVVLGTANPVFGPFLQFAQSPAARERMWRARTSQGGEGNMALLAELAQQRREYAQLFGFTNYGDFALRRRMAGSTSRVTKFLDDVQAAVRVGETKDIGELRAARARLDGTPPDKTAMERWDVSYYTEVVRKEKYNVDAETFRPYFPPQESLQFVMRVAEKMFDIRYVRVPGAYWHPEVQGYAVIDNRTRQPIASLYVDLYPREGKYKHAAVWALATASTATHRLPAAALVVNFDRQGLTLDELETLLHEFGHSLHDNLSAVRWSAVARTPRDFVEAPSQMLEDWVYDARVLKVFQEVCPTCKRVPDELLAQATAARDFGKGIRYARQHLYASYDMALNTAAAPDPTATWAKMEGATPLGHVDGTIFPSTFTHIAGDGYTAGYYGYLWCLVVAMDLRTAFAADKLDPAVGARYRANVISQGGQKPPADLVKDFLGRDFSSGPFFEYMKK